MQGEDMLVPCGRCDKDYHFSETMYLFDIPICKKCQEEVLLLNLMDPLEVAQKRAVRVLSHMEELFSPLNLNTYMGNDSLLDFCLTDTCDEG